MHRLASRSLFFAALAALLLPAATGCREAAEPPADALLVGATLVSPHLPAPVADSWVLLRGGRIEAVGQGAPPPAESAERHDLAGRFLVPGLFDAHVHLQSVPGLSHAMQSEHGELVDAYFEQLPRSYLYHGFTTLLDLAPTDPRLLARLARRHPAPDVLACGPPIPLAGGYPALFVPQRVRYRVFGNALLDPGAVTDPTARLRPEEHTPAAVLDRVEAAEGVCAKTFVEDGFGLAAGWPVPSEELLSELVAEAERRGLPLAVHANSVDSYRLSLDAGAGLLVHGAWTWDAAQPLDDGETLPAEVESLLSRVVEDGVAVMPTLRVLAGDGALFDPRFLDDPALVAVLPPAVLAWYRSDDGGWFRDTLIADMPPGERTPEAVRAVHRRALSRARRATAWLAAHDGRLLFGSDTPSGPSYGNPPGYNGYLELRALADAGLPLDRLLAAATLDNARAFGVADRYGSIEPGKVAHLLVLGADPLASVEAYDEIETVIVAGRWLERHGLRADAP